MRSDRTTSTAATPKLRPRRLIRRAALALGTWLAAGCSQPPANNHPPPSYRCDGGAAPGDGCAAPPFSVQTSPLVQNTAGPGTVDSDLRNAWGLVVDPTGALWVADNAASQAKNYDVAGRVLAAAITIPGLAGGGAPSGAVYNGSADFSGDRLIFATEDGLLVGWQSGSAAVKRADRSPSAVYKGLALAAYGGNNYLYAANFGTGAIDVFDRAYASAALPGSFTDPSVPAGFAPFNVAYLGGMLYVAYARPDSDHHDDVAGPGSGQVAVFDTAGRLQRHLISGGALNSPWGLTIAPQGLGPFTGTLLIGNFGDGRLNAFQPDSGQLIAPLPGGDGSPLVIDGLWGIVPGNGVGAAASSTLFFTAGPNGEKDGLLGKLVAAP